MELLDPIEGLLNQWLVLLENSWSQGRLLGVVVVAIFYFAPSLVAYGIEHPKRHAIAALNLFLGWTFLGWIVAFFWAGSRVGKGKTGPVPNEALDTDFDGD